MVSDLSLRMSEINLDDELLAISLLYPGYKKREGLDPHKLVEVYNRVKDISYKITFVLNDYPKNAARFFSLFSHIVL